MVLISVGRTDEGKHEDRHCANESRDQYILAGANAH
jgi:hypothetical protein